MCEARATVNAVQAIEAATKACHRRRDDVAQCRGAIFERLKHLATKAKYRRLNLEGWLGGGANDNDEILTRVVFSVARFVRKEVARKRPDHHLHLASEQLAVARPSFGTVEAADVMAAAESLVSPTERLVFNVMRRIGPDCATAALELGWPKHR